MGTNEEMRKIQFTGKSSYIVSLPKQWIMDMGLKQGDQVAVVRQGVSNLQIVPLKHHNKPVGTEEATIEIKPEDEDSTIVRKLISLYLLGFTIINVKSKVGRLKPSQRNSIKDAVKSILMGTEITADSVEGITIQVLINLFELSVDGALKRMLIIAKSMQNDALLAQEEANFELAKEVINSDDEVDRFNLYVVRQLKMAIQNPRIIKEIGLKNARDCLGYRLVTKSVERTAYHAASIAKNVLLLKEPINEEILGNLEEMSRLAISMFETAIESLFRLDFNLAETVIQKTKDVNFTMKEALLSSKRIGIEEIANVRLVIESLRRTAEYASDIAEIVLNLTVESIIG